MAQEVIHNAQQGAMDVAQLGLDANCDVAAHLQAGYISAPVETNKTQERLKVNGEVVDGQDKVLNEGALSLLSSLCRQFAAEVSELLENRKSQQAKYDAGGTLDFLPQTKAVREGNWQVRGIPADLINRRVEIAGSVDPLMLINGLNSNANVFVADLEDSPASSWNELIEKQVNLRDAVRGEIEYTSPETGKYYLLNDAPAVLSCRVRGLHMVENHLEFDEAAIPAALFDFALYFYNNYRQLLAKGSGPYFYLPKMESHLEAKWWAKVFAFVEERFCLQPGTIKCTCLIETLPAVFEMDEILFELRSNIVALNCGRWDSDFSYINTGRNHSDELSTDKQMFTVGESFLSVYSRLLVKTCHKRGALAIGGVATYFQAKTNEISAERLEKIRIDKELEARNGHDGTCVEHLELVDAVTEIFNQYIGAEQANQLHITRDVDGPISARELLQGVGITTNVRLDIRADSESNAA